MIKTIKNLVQVPGRPESYSYQTRDGQRFPDLDQAVEHDNSLVPDQKEPVVYEQVWTIQEAINKAVAENRVVRFLWDKPNADIKKGIVDKKGCQIMKPDKDSRDIAVIPPGIENFDFGDVDLRIEIPLR